jgi:pyruvate/2-oxoglutarate/acetoin dehydrogenase E1 component
MTIDVATAQMTGRQALNHTLRLEMRRSDQVLVMGETVRHVGAAGVTADLFGEFPDRVIETPVSENAIIGSALGLALEGFVPVVEIYCADFMLAIANELINDIPKWRQQQRRSGPLPLVIRACMGATAGLGPEHSQSMEPYLHHAPGLTVITPGTPSDMAGLLRASIRGGEPVVLLEHRKVYDATGPVDTDPDFMVPIGRAETVLDGDRVTLVAWGWMRHLAEQAAEQLIGEGISVELIDPRTVRPMDWSTVLESVARTRRLVVVEEAPVTGSVAAEVVARVAEAGLGEVTCRRVTMPDAIHPYSATMEAELLPTVASITTAVRAVLA